MKFTAAQLLAHLKHTRLEGIEFGYLVVGHTHNLVDAMFALINHAIHGVDLLNVPSIFKVLNAKMKHPPIWKHLRDIWGFRNAQPVHLSTSRIKGVTWPHHWHITWASNGTLILQSKP